MNQTKTKKLIVEKILKQGGGKIQVENILSYLTDHSEDFTELDLVHKQWVLDQITEIGSTALFFGDFNTEQSLFSASTEGVTGGAYALVGSGEDLIYYNWDIDLGQWSNSNPVFSDNISDIQ